MAVGNTGHPPEREASWPLFALTGAIVALMVASPYVSGAFADHQALAAWFTG